MRTSGTAIKFPFHGSGGGRECISTQNLLANLQVNAVTIGMVLDHYGPRLTAILGSFFFAVGTFLFGIGSDCTLYWKLFINAKLLILTSLATFSWD